MKIMYRTCLHIIKAVPIERETEHSVWVSGRKRAKVTGWDNYHDTWEDAKAYLIGEATGKVKTLKLKLEHAERNVHRIRNLTLPDQT